MLSTVFKLKVIKSVWTYFAYIIEETKHRYDSKRQIVNNATSAGNVEYLKNKKMQ